MLEKGLGHPYLKGQIFSVAGRIGGLEKTFKKRWAYYLVFSRSVVGLSAEIFLLWNLETQARYWKQATPKLNVAANAIAK